MNGGYASGFQTGLKAQIEIGRIDADEYIRGFASPALEQLLAQPQQPRNSRQRFDQPENSKHIGLFENFTACSCHFRPGNTFEFGCRDGLPDGANQPRTQQIPGCLAGDQCDAHASPATALDNATDRPRLVYSGGLAGPVA